MVVTERSLRWIRCTPRSVTRLRPPPRLRSRPSEPRRSVRARRNGPQPLLRHVPPPAKRLVQRSPLESGKSAMIRRLIRGRRSEPKPPRQQLQLRRPQPPLSSGRNGVLHHCAACGCDACAKQLALPWKPGVDRAEQPRYARNKKCVLWPSYEGANDWKIRQLQPKTAAEAKGTHESMKCVLEAMVARISLLIKEGEIAAVGTSDEDTLGYYLVKWLSEPYTLQEDTEGMVKGVMLKAGTLVVDAEWLNPVGGASLWYTPAPDLPMVPIEVAHVLLTGLQLLPLSDANKLPANMARKAKEAAARQKAAKVEAADHEAIMEEATRRDRLEYDEDSEEEDEDSEEEDEPESEEDEPEMSDED